MKLKLKNGEYLEIDFKDFVWAVFIANITATAVIYAILLGLVLLMAILGFWI
jgi:hypothetical protein